MNKVFIAPNGKLYKEKKYFLMYPCCCEIDSISVTELWGDSYQGNLKDKDCILIPADYGIFPIIEYKEKERQFIEQGGGFRINL